MSRTATRDTLLEVGRRVFLEKGYSNAGLEAILQAAGVPKGSFYHYFASKEDFGLQVLDRFAGWIGGEFERCMAESGIGPVGRLRRFFEWGVERLGTQAGRDGCLVGNLGLELAGQSETFRCRFEEIFQGRCDRIATCLEEAQRAGELPGQLDARILAGFLLNSWQGALLRSKTMRSTEPLRAFLAVAFDSLLRPCPDQDGSRKDGFSPVASSAPRGA